MAPKIILVVEGNENDAALIRVAIQRLGTPHLVRWVSTTEEALSYLIGTGDYQNRSEFPLPSLTLMGLKFAGRGGLDLLHFIGQHPTLAGMPVMVFTSSASLDCLDRAYQLGACCFQQKPGDFRQLQSVLKGVLKFWVDAPAPANALAA